MKKESELSGYWWADSQEDKKIFGTLDIVNTTLKLIGSFSSNAPTFFANLSKYEKIEGISTTNKRIILINCWDVGYERRLLAESAPFEPPPLTSIFANQIFITDNSNNVQILELAFNTIFVTFSHLADWLGPRLIKSDFITDGSNKTKGIEARLEYLDVPEILLSDFKITIGQRFTTSGDSIRVHSIHPLVGLRIQHSEFLSMETWMNGFIRPLNNFLSLGVGQPTDVTGVQAYHDSNVRKVKFDNESFSELPIPFHFYDTQIAANQNKDYKEPNLQTRVFDLSDIRNTIQEVFEEWFSINNDENLRRIVDLISSIERSPLMPVEDKFLNTIRALEVYHRERFSDAVLPKELHKQIVEKVLSTFSSESEKDKNIREWLNEKLSYSNGPTLRQRIEELLKSPNPFSDLFTENVAKYAKLTSKTRNFLTHPSDDKKDVLDFIGMHHFQQNMVLMLKAFLLSDIKIDVGTGFSSLQNLLRESYKNISQYLES